MNTKTLATILDDAYCQEYHSGKVVTDSGHEYIFDIRKKAFLITDDDGMLHLCETDTHRFVFIPCAKVEHITFTP